MNWRNVIKPGCLDDRIRVFYFFIFICITVIQSWLALRMEEELANESHDEKYPINNPFKIVDQFQVS